MHRLYNLDYLRGLAAFGIMIYHYIGWVSGNSHSESFMGRVGVYGVSIFYVLSGLTLYYVYYDKMTPSMDEVLAFFKKRVFRILPLLWLVTILSIVLLKQKQDISTIVYNLTGLFGFLEWNKYIATGAWSIGNELVFYVFFPLFIMAAKRSKISFALFSVLIFSIYLYFTFFVLTTSLELSDQWRDYVNPLNQLFFFLGGFLIGYIFKNVVIKNFLSIAIILIGFGLFVLYPVTGNQVYLVTGFTRVTFTLSCLLICLGFYKLTIKLPDTLHKPLTLLGEASYSVYLLHPIVYFIISSKYMVPLSGGVRFTLAVCCTLVLSYFVYEYFEKYFVNLGKKKPQRISV